jgi:hypothetical protein
LPASGTSVKTSRSVYGSSAVEVEVSGWPLLEPEPIVLGRVLKEVGCLL